MQGIDNNYISNAIDELVGLLGIKEEIPILPTHRSLDTRNVKLYIEYIANYLGLPIIINLSHVPANYQAKTPLIIFMHSAASIAAKSLL